MFVRLAGLWLGLLLIACQGTAPTKSAPVQAIPIPAANSEQYKFTPEPARNAWTQGCDRDLVTRAQSCWIRKRVIALDHITSAPSMTLMQVIQVQGKWVCLMFGVHDHPGRQGLVRIGQNETIYYDKHLCGELAEKVIDQMLHSSEGAARSVKWPSKSQDIVFTTEGFPEAYAGLQALIASPKP